MNSNVDFIAIIPSQCGSKRLKDKNLQTINGKTLVDYAIEYAMKSTHVSKIIVSTNSEDIKQECAKKYPTIEVFDRPDCMCGDVDVIDVYKFVVEKQLCEDINKCDRKLYVVGIQPDNPDRSVRLDDAIEYCISNNYDDCLTVGHDCHRNGSLRIIDLNYAFSNGIRQPRIGILQDTCTNIHNEKDLNRARHSMSSKTISLSNGFEIGGNRTFIIAEAACNHMCSLGLAKKMILDAKSAGADAIKFQTYKAETHVTCGAVSYWGNKPMKQIDYYKNLDKFGLEEYNTLFEFAYEVGIMPFSTPFDLNSARLLNSLGMEIFKIPSMAINDIELLKEIASFGKPIVMSTGGSTLQEIDRAIDVIFGENNFKLILLACNLSYPTQNKDANLCRIKTLKDKYPNFIVGYSDHTYPDDHMVIPSLTIPMGAKVIEKHFTLDKTAIGSGQFFSIDADDLRKMVKNIRLAETVFGNGTIDVSESEKGAVSGSRKSVVVNVPSIPEGETILSSMIIGKRPGTGIPIDRIKDVIGKKTNKILNYDDLIQWEDLI